MKPTTKGVCEYRGNTAELHKVKIEGSDKTMMVSLDITRLKMVNGKLKAFL